MKKYLLISMLCMGLGGYVSAEAGAVQKNKTPLKAVQKGKAVHPSNINYVKIEKFLAWYETSVTQGKVFHDSVTKAYDKAKNHVQKARKPLTANRKNGAKSQAAFFLPFDTSHHAKSARKQGHAASCLKKYSISCKHFGKKGVVITRPGYYCLAENVAYKPHYDHVPAITIRSDDVILDLSTHVLTQCPRTFDQFDDISAIVVESGYNFVTIKNGQIRNFSNNGVIVKSDNGSPDDHHGIVIEKISVHDCGKITTATDLDPFNSRSGIGVYGTTDCVIQDCETSGITSLIDTEAIATFFTDNILIKNCLSHANSAEPDEGFPTGIEVNFFNNATIEGCSSIKNIGSQPVGIYILEGTSLVMRDCRGNENVANFPTIARAAAYGIVVQGVNGGVLTDSQGNFNVAKSESLTLRKFCTGIQSALSNIEISNCEASFNLATSDTGLSGGGCVGFDINTVESCVLKNCTAEGNSNYSIDQVGNGGIVAGFDCDNASNVLLEDCVAIGNNPQPNGTPLAVAGFYASIFPEGGDFANIVYKNCASFNHSCDFEGTTVAGFLLGEAPPTAIVVHPTQIILDSCIAEGNVNTSNPGIGAGVSVENGTTLSTVVNCILKGNGVGILVRGADTFSNQFENNELTANAVYGIEDASGNSNSYAKNYAYNPDALGNYTGLPAFTPIRTWQIGSAPAAVDNNGILDPLDNFSVTN